MTQTEARERVARGAALLDEKRPGWHTRINTGTLTLHDPCGCIVGQLCGGQYSVGLRQLLEAYTGNGEDEDFGFEMPAEERVQWLRGSRELYQPLQDAWIEAIADRLVPTSDEGQAADAVATPVQVSNERPIAQETER